MAIDRPDRNERIAKRENAKTAAASHSGARKGSLEYILTSAYGFVRNIFK